MKRLILILLGIVFLCIASYAVAYHLASRPSQQMSGEKYGELQWVKQEFKLTDTQFSKIERLHENYMPKCEDMCQRVRKSNEAVEKAIQTGQGQTPQLSLALDQQREIREECQTAMLGYIYSVSQEMAPEQGRRYVQMMGKHILDPVQNGQMPQFKNESKQRP